MTLNNFRFIQNFNIKMKRKIAANSSTEYVQFKSIVMQFPLFIEASPNEGPDKTVKEENFTGPNDN